MRQHLRAPLVGLALAMAATTALGAQPAAPAAAAVPAIGALAPDFEIRGATRYGLLREGVKVSDFRGQTVVLAFFARVRTRG